MKALVDLTTWLLEKDIRTKNAASLLLALITVAIVYFTSLGSAWLEDLDRRGPLGLPVALSAVFLAAFLLYWLIGSAWMQAAASRAARRKQEASVERRERQIVDTLESLTEWQRSFVFRYIVEGTTQIQEYEIGGYKAVWGSEVQMLIQKGVIHQHRRAGVYEIDSAYRKFLELHLDSDSRGVG